MGLGSNPLSSFRVAAGALLISLLGLPSFAQQPKVLAPHRPVPPLIPPAQRQPLQSAKAGSLAGGLWITDPNTHSTLYLKNVIDTAPITVSPIVFLSNGNKYALPAVTLDPSGTAVIDINAALQNFGIASFAQLSGYVEVDYNWPWVPVCATIRVVDVIHSTIFTYGIPPSPAGSSKPVSQGTSNVFGLWWKYNSNVTAFVSLANISSQVVLANVSVTDAQGNVLGTHNVNVPPNGTKIVTLSELQQSTATEGGTQVTYTGPVGSLDVNGGIADQSIGYSANLRFASAPSGGLSSNTVAASGLMVGPADPMMLFPAGTAFTPYSILRNLSSAPMSVTPILWWMQGGSAHSYPMGALTLAPGQVQRLNVASSLAAAGLTNFSGTITIEFDDQAPQDALLVQAGSADQTGTYVFEVTPRGIAESAARSLGYWSTANGDDTMVTLWNPADEAQDFTFTVFFSGGHYLLPIHLEARQTESFNISSIIQTQVPDIDGNIIPASVHEGSARISGIHADAEHILVSIDIGIYNVRKATCGGGCIYCDGYTSWYPVFPGSAAFAVQATKQFNLYGTWSNGAQYNIANSWSSSNTSVSSVNSSSGMATGVAGGSATITAFYGTIPIYTGQTCMNGTSPYCPAYTSGSQSGTGNVVQITGVNPSQITLGTSGVMTITGTNFNLLSSPVTVSTDGGVLVGSVVVQNTTTITATYNATNCSIALGLQNLWISAPTTDGGQLRTPNWAISVVSPQAPAPKVLLGGSDVTGKTQTVAAGQQVALSASIPTLPACTSLASQQWTTPPGVAVGGYTATNNSASVSALPTTAAGSYAYYWVDTASARNMTYQYTLNTGITSPPATTTFNVVGPTSLAVTVTKSPVVISTVKDSNNNTLNMISLGTLSGTYPSDLSGSPAGITFAVSATQPSGYPAWGFRWVQIITGGTTKFIAGSTTTCTTTSGLDNLYPYDLGTSVSDSPGLQLVSANTEETTTLNATMYLMWDSGATNSIPVPLGYVSWSWSGDAKQSSGKWSVVSGSGGPLNATAPFTTSNSYPTWASKVTNGTCSGT